MKFTTITSALAVCFGFLLTSNNSVQAQECLGLAANACTSNSFNISVSTWRVATGGDNCADNPADGTGEYEFTIELAATANQRYDVGVFINTEGGSAQTETMGCYNDSLTPTNSTGACDSDGDGNSCLDVDAGATGCDPGGVAFLTTQTVTVDCSLFNPATGDISFDTCVAWDNNQSGACSGPPVEAEPTSQCDCATLVAEGDVFLPVELADFEVANTGAGELSLSWRTLSESNNSGFEIQTSYQGGAYEMANWVDGQGTTESENSYSLLLSDMKPGGYSVRLKQIDFDGAFTYSPEVEVDVDIPEGFMLSEVYPNPFNPNAVVEFGIAESSEVTVALYDMTGRVVQELYRGTPEANRVLEANINGALLPSGVYIVQLEGLNFKASQKAVILK